MPTTADKLVSGWMISADDGKKLDNKPAVFAALLKFVEAIDKVSVRLDTDPEFLDTFDSAWFGWLIIGQVDDLMKRLRAGDEAHSATLEQQARADAIRDMAASL